MAEHCLSHENISNNCAKIADIKGDTERIESELKAMRLEQRLLFDTLQEQISTEKAERMLLADRIDTDRRIGLIGFGVLASLLTPLVIHMLKVTFGGT